MNNDTKEKTKGWERGGGYGGGAVKNSFANKNLFIHKVSFSCDLISSRTQNNQSEKPTAVMMQTSLELFVSFGVPFLSLGHTTCAMLSSSLFQKQLWAVWMPAPVLCIIWQVTTYL